SFVAMNDALCEIEKRLIQQKTPEEYTQVIRRVRAEFFSGSHQASIDQLKSKYGDAVECEYRPDLEKEELLILVSIRAGFETIEKEIEAMGFKREEDVLDTWFSSALWPHSTMGWPEPTPELKYYYPTSVLITSRDIITLWVA